MTREPVSGDRLMIQRKREPGALVLALFGELDLATAPRLRNAFEAAESAGATRLTVDLRGLEFIDAAGLRVLLAANRRAQENGHRFSLLKGRRAVQRLFELTQASTLFRFDG